MSKSKILREFVAKNGKRVVLRKPRWEDLDDLLVFINSLVDEGADILQEEHVTREQEADWLGKRLASIEKGETIGIVAEVDGKVVANSEVARRRGPMSHIGVLGIGVKREYRGIGIGKELMKTLIEESKKAGLKVLVLDVMDSNKAAKSLYTKMGFKKTGKIPKGIFRKGRYIDLLRMTLEL
jgi:ribosomal protein S18 acetylase RimI-like enzyme